MCPLPPVVVATHPGTCPTPCCTALAVIVALFTVVLSAPAPVAPLLLLHIHVVEVLLQHQTNSREPNFTGIRGANHTIKRGPVIVAAATTTTHRPRPGARHST
jgi:hypothetical protein